MCFTHGLCYICVDMILIFKTTGDRLIFANGYGLANMDYDLPITAESAFNLASVSKRFTGACIAVLILDKKLSLDDPAANYLPKLAKYEHEIPQTITALSRLD